LWLNEIANLASQLVLSQFRIQFMKILRNIILAPESQVHHKIRMIQETNLMQLCRNNATGHSLEEIPEVILQDTDPPEIHQEEILQTIPTEGHQVLSQEMIHPEDTHQLQVANMEEGEGEIRRIHQIHHQEEEVQEEVEVHLMTMMTQVMMKTNQVSIHPSCVHNAKIRFATPPEQQVRPTMQETPPLILA